MLKVVAVPTTLEALVVAAGVKEAIRDKAAEEYAYKLKGYARALENGLCSTLEAAKSVDKATQKFLRIDQEYVQALTLAQRAGGML